MVKGGRDMGTTGAVRAEFREVGGHTVIDLVGERTALVLAPALGGRLLSLTLDGREFLHRDPELLDDACGARNPADVGPHDGTMADWRNWGGDKTWPAPQGWSGPGAWAGPPDPVLDSGAYTPRISRASDGSAATVELTSEPDPRTGLRLRREFTLTAGSTCYTLRLSAENTTDQPVRWALWNVTQLPGHPAELPGDGVWVGLAGGGLPASTDLVAGTGNPRTEQPGPRLLHIPAQDVVGKVGFPDASGWIAHVGPAGTWAYHFDVDPDAPYTDGGARAEVWLEYPLDAPLAHLGDLRPAHRIVECEVLGPYTVLAPGATTELTGTVALGPRAGTVHDVSGHGWWNEPLTLEQGSVDGELSVRGACVPWTDGELRLRALSADGRLLAVRSLGDLRAGSACTVDVRLDSHDADPSGRISAVEVVGVRRDVLGRAELGAGTS